MEFSERQIEQYSRHILLQEIGVRGQKRLRAARVFVVGAGGLGSAALMYLAAAGVGELGIADGDRVEQSNLQRQILYGQDDVGRSKVQCARESLHRINPDCRVQALAERMTAGNIRAILRGYDAVLDGSDNFATRFLVADCCRLEKIPLVSAAVIGFEGQLLTVLPGKNNPCYRCFIPEPPDVVPTCGEAGVLGPAVGVMGTLQAVETVKLVLGIGELLSHHLLIYKALSGEFRRVYRPVDAGCPLCGPRAIVTDLVEYGVTCHDQ